MQNKRKLVVQGNCLVRTGKIRDRENLSKNRLNQQISLARKKNKRQLKSNFKGICDECALAGHCWVLMPESRYPQSFQYHESHRFCLDLFLELIG